MIITVVGTGNMGSSFVKRFTLAGHQVRVTGRDLTKAHTLAAQFNGAQAVPAAAAAQGAQVIVLATAYGDAVSALSSLGDISGKVVIDITNPLSADYMSLTLGHSTSAAEEIANAFPAVHIVKAFNTTFAQVIAEGAAFAAGQVAPVFYAGDDTEAKATVQTLIASTGFKPVDAGSLRNARYLEPLAGLNIYFGYGAGLGTNIVPAWLSRA